MTKFIFSLLFILILSCTPNKKTKGEEFEIPSTQGQFRTQDHLGKKIFIFFGFTKCPKVCPTTLFQLRHMQKLLSNRDKEKMITLFISVDRERDSLEVIQKKLAGFPKNFIGATDSEEKLARLLKIFGASFKVIKFKDPKDMIIDHTAFVYVLNSLGHWVGTLRYDASANEFLEAFHSADSLSPLPASKRLAPPLNSSTSKHEIFK
jgi:protein SCO1